MTALIFTLFGTTSVIEFDATMTEVHTSSAKATSHPVEKGASVTDHVRPELDRVQLEAMITNTPINDVSAETFAGARRVASMRGAQTYLTLNAQTSRQSKTATFKGLPSVSSAKAFSRIASGPGSTILTYKPPFATGMTPKIEVVPGERSNVPNTHTTTSLQFASPLDRVKEVYEVLRMLCTSGVEVRLITDLREYPTMVIEQLTSPKTIMQAMTFSVSLKEIRFAEVKSGEVAVKRVADKRLEPQADESSKPTFSFTDEEANTLESAAVQASGSSRALAPGTQVE